MLFRSNMFLKNVSRLGELPRVCCDENGKPLEAKDAMQRVLEIKDGLASRLGADAFPNWIGPQRFGSTRPVTPEVGRAVVDGDFEKAVDLYLGMPGLKMKDDVSNFRKLWRESKDPKACLEIVLSQLVRKTCQQYLYILYLLKLIL